MPVSVRWAENIYGASYQTLIEMPEDIEAIVVLGGGMKHKGGRWERSYPGARTSFRLLHAKYLYSLKPMPIILSGGDWLKSGASEASSMKNILIELGVPSIDLIMENRSNTTYENAFYSDKIIKEHRFKKVVIVTDMVHIRRGYACFQKLGVNCIASVPGNLKTTKKSGGPFYSQFFPTVETFQRFSDLHHEILGCVFYWLTSKI